jgi:SAM-dependent methyltransferase
MALRAGRRVRAVVERRPVVWGSLRRFAPIGRSWGASRGVPIDRYYIDAFIAAHGSHITGRVLEVKEDLYASRYGHELSTIDILDIDPANRRATVIADLGQPSALPVATYDCIIVTQTLQFVARLDVAFAGLWAALRPGGCLLVSVPCVSRLEPSLAEVECWRLLPAGLKALLAQHCPGGQIDGQGRGNQLVATAFLAGLAVRDLRASELDHDDPLCPLVSLGAVVRP